MNDTTNAACIGIQYGSIHNGGFAANELDEINVAAAALSRIEDEAGFSWEDQEKDWESLCYAIAEQVNEDEVGAAGWDWEKWIREQLSPCPVSVQAHTPGPWSAVACTTRNGFTIGQAPIAGRAAFATNIAQVGPFPANAHLLAAAPELLAACIAMLETGRLTQLTPNIVKQARQAIENATKGTR